MKILKKLIKRVLNRTDDKKVVKLVLKEGGLRKRTVKKCSIKSEKKTIKRAA